MAHLYSSVLESHDSDWWASMHQDCELRKMWARSAVFDNLYDFISQIAPRPMMFPTADRRWKPLPELSVEESSLSSVAYGLEIQVEHYWTLRRFHNQVFRRASCFDKKKKKKKTYIDIFSLHPDFSRLEAGDICLSANFHNRSLRRWTAAYVLFELNSLTPALPAVPNAEEWIVCLLKVGRWSRVMSSRRGIAAVAQRWPHYINANSSRIWLISPSPVYRGYGPNAPRLTTSHSKKSAL